MLGTDLRKLDPFPAAWPETGGALCFVLWKVEQSVAPQLTVSWRSQPCGCVLLVWMTVREKAVTDLLPVTTLASDAPCRDRTFFLGVDTVRVDHAYFHRLSY